MTRERKKTFVKSRWGWLKEKKTIENGYIKRRKYVRFGVLLNINTYQEIKIMYNLS